MRGAPHNGLASAKGEQDRNQDGTHRRTLSAEGGKINVFRKNGTLGRHTG
jgi:hypothetical protein